MSESGIAAQLAFVAAHRQQDEAMVLVEAVREGVRALYRDALIEAYLLGRLGRERLVAELGAAAVNEIEYQRQSLERDVRWGLANA